MSVIHGINTEKDITPKMVVEAIVNCFYKAHCEHTGLVELKPENNDVKGYCLQIVKKAFSETGGNFDNPSKESLKKSLPWLANFSKDFRDQATIQRHMSEIQDLIKLIP